MKQALQKQSSRQPVAAQMKQRLREGLFILSIAAALFLFISFGSFNLSDPGWSSTGSGEKVLNWGGKAGAFFFGRFSFHFWLHCLFITIFNYVFSLDRHQA